MISGHCAVATEPLNYPSQPDLNFSGRLEFYPTLWSSAGRRKYNKARLAPRRRSPRSAQ